MLAITLLAIASSAIGWKMHRAVAKKQFQAQLERLNERVSVTQKLAVSMQADWKGILRKNKEGWVFETLCDELPAKKFAPLRLEALYIRFNGKVIDEITVDFFASGKVFPVGTFTINRGKEKAQVEISNLFEEGKKSGPAHP